MAEKTVTFVRGGINLEKDEQITRMMVWPLDPETRKPMPARVKIVKSATGKDAKEEKAEKVEIPRIPLFRWRHTLARLESWQLSSFWLDLRSAMWHRWGSVPVVKDVAEYVGNDGLAEEETEVLPLVKTHGVVNERTNETGSCDRSIMWTDIPYKVDVYRGAFCFNRDTGKSEPLTSGNVQAVVNAFKIQAANRDTVGIEGDPGFPKHLWTPFSHGWTLAERKEIEEYEANLDLFKSWIGKLVYWEFEVVDTAKVLR